MATIQDLQKRLTAGEVYLAENRGDKQAEALYWRLTAEHTALVEQQEREAEIAAVTLALPPGCAWSRTPDSLPCSQVRVLFHGEPMAADDITRIELATLLRTRGEILEQEKKGSA